MNVNRDREPPRGANDRTFTHLAIAWGYSYMLSIPMVGRKRPPAPVKGFTSMFVQSLNSVRNDPRFESCVRIAVPCWAKEDT